MHRWRFDLRTGRTHEEDLDDQVTEYPMVNGRHGGRPYRYSYNTIPQPGFWLLDGLKKYDLATGKTQTWTTEPGCHLSESPFAPRDGATEEDDGYLVSFVADLRSGRGECAIFDADGHRARADRAGDPPPAGPDGHPRFLGPRVHARRVTHHTHPARPPARPSGREETFMTRVAILDDYQGVADDGRLVGGGQAVQLTVIHERLATPIALVARGGRRATIVGAMRERTPFPRGASSACRACALLMTTGTRNAAIDVAAARAHGITVCGTASRPARRRRVGDGR